MDSAFLLVATRHADDVSAGALELVEEPRIDGLGFEPADHVQWRADSGTMALGAWQGTTWPWSEAAWHVEDDQAVMVTGHAWWQGETRAQSRSGWAVDVADSARTEPLAETAERLRGIFAIVRCSASGDVAAASDPLGFRCLYYGESADVAVVSSRAELAAKALAGTGTPAQDALGACWLPYTT